MGTWSGDPFGNDEAGDFVDSLETAAGAEELLRPLEEAESAEGGIDSTTAQVAIAVAAIIAEAAQEKKRRGFPKEAWTFIARTGYVPTMDHIKRAKKVLGLILKDSELKELWEEGDDLEEWTDEMEKLLADLDAASKSPMPKRAPKKQSLPRNLEKLVKVPNASTDPKVRAAVQKALARLANVNFTDKYTLYIPLSLVAGLGFKEEVEDLLNRGANPNYRTEICDLALGKAVANEHFEVADLLIERGASLDSSIKVIYEDMMDEYSGCHALKTIARKGTAAGIEYMASKGVDLSKPVDFDDTPLYIAASSGNAGVMRKLLELGVDPDPKETRINDRPYHAAVLLGTTEAVEILLEAGVDPNAWADNSDKTPYEYARDHREDEPEMAEVIRKYGGKTMAELQEK